MSWCLRPSEADKFKKDIIDGTVDPEKLRDMSSKERRDFFAERFGESNAEPINRLLEQKFLLKNQQQGFISWANKLLVPTEVKRDLISRIERMDNVLTAKDEQSFMEDLASHRLGTRVTHEEASSIAEMANKIDEARAAMDAGGDRLEYGRAVVDLKRYVNDLKQDAFKVGFKESIKHPLDTAVRAVKAIPGTAKAIQASMDNSAIFRQGWKTMWTHPRIWAVNSVKSFAHLFGKYGPDTVMREIDADIASRPTFDMMQKAKLDVGANEEAFPTTLPEKVPILGRAYKRTETAYTAFVRKTRADVFDKYIDIAKENGVELSNDELVSIGKMVNSLTGRGHLGKLEPAGKAINNLFFSPKMLASHIQTLTQPITGAGGSSFVRRQAAYNLIKMTAGTAAVLATAKALLPKDSVELDPRSSDFGKIKVGNTRFDVTGGMGSVLVLLSRLSTAAAKATTGAKIMSYKSSTTGQMQDLTSPEFGKQNLLDIVESFFENKLSPVAGVARDFAKGKTFDGKKPTPTGEALGLLTPLPANTIRELLKDPKARQDPRFIALAQIADMLGINVNTYSSKQGGVAKEDVTLHDLLDLAESLPSEISGEPKK